MDSTPPAELGHPRLQMRWVEVTDAKGRTHMESVWIDASRLPASSTPAA